MYLNKWKCAGWPRKIRKRISVFAVVSELFFWSLLFFTFLIGERNERERDEETPFPGFHPLSRKYFFAQARLSYFEGLNIFLFSRVKAEIKNNWMRRVRLKTKKDAERRHKRKREKN